VQGLQQLTATMADAVLPSVTPGKGGKWNGAGYAVVSAWQKLLDSQAQRNIRATCLWFHYRDTDAQRAPTDDRPGSQARPSLAGLESGQPTAPLTTAV